MSGAPFLVVFDCDGTIVDSQHIITAAMTKAFADFDLAPPPRDAVLSIVGLSLVEAVGRIAPNLAEEKVVEVAAGYKAAFNSIRKRQDLAEPAYDGALDVIHMLGKRDDVVLGIATGKSQRGVARLLEHFDIGRYFVTIQTADDAPSKPHPAMLHQAMAETGVDAARTVMIGDTTFDMEMATNADVSAIGVSWGYHPAHHLDAAGAGAVIDHFNELDPVLSRLWQED